MAREPRFYGPLKDTHQKVADELDQGIEHEAEQACEQTPTRPEGHPAERPGWTDRGDMASQQASAIEWVKKGASQREQQAARAERSAEDLHEQFPGLTRGDEDSERGLDQEDHDLDKGIDNSSDRSGRDR
jgi:hypothetical protein